MGRVRTFDIKHLKIYSYHSGNRACSGRDHMVVGFITSYAISAYHH